MKPLFEDHQRNDVIRVAAYHRRDFEVFIIRSLSSEHQPIRSSIAEAFSSTALSSLGI